MSSLTQRILVEVAIASVDDAHTARDGGADRLELSGALAMGGLTPSLGLLIEVRQTISLPLIVLARPRSGGFAYSSSEFRVLQRDIDLALTNGADGIAFGVLTPAGQIDYQRCTEIVKQIGARTAVFHRAFDVTTDPQIALEQLIDLGVKRVMTSGQEESALRGASRIVALLAQAARRIEVLPACGINPLTVADLIRGTGCDQVHASLREERIDRSTAGRPQVRFGRAALPPEDRYDATSPDAVRQLRTILSGR
jgi:copper homeostasis protein